MRQSTPERTVRPARRAARYRPAASRNTSASSGDSRIVKASMASRATANARSSRNPCNTSCTIGSTVTTSSTSTRSASRRRAGFRNTSIHTDVSTSTTAGLSAGPVRGGILAHDRQIALPQPAARQLENPSGLPSPDEFLERALDSPRVRPLAAQADGLLEQIFIEHKICTFHVYSVLREPMRMQGSRRIGGAGGRKGLRSLAGVLSPEWLGPLPPISI